MPVRFAMAASLAALLAAGPAKAAEPTSDGPTRVRATVELIDGSRLVGTPSGELITLTLDYDRLEIPLTKIRRWDAVAPLKTSAAGTDRPDSANKVTVQLTNGDRITGVLNQPKLQLDTILGPLTPKLKLVRSVSYTAWREGNMPPGEGELAFDGLNWTPLRTEFEIDGDRLKSLPKARAGFQYGHEGHGRGAMLVANIGDPDWRDYSLDVQVCAAGLDPAFNRYGLGGDWHDVSLMFHITDLKESQNERGSSYYVIGFHGDGSWELRAVYNAYCDQPMGWGSPHCDGERTLAHGNGLNLDRLNGNHVRIDVAGNRIQTWFDEANLLDVVDDQMATEIGGQRLDHGGIGFGGGFEGMFWIKNLSVRSLGNLRNADAR
ncbi:MAG: hypothetical protein QM770_17465 [Tepidisphaeraceae bacterium]